MRPAPTQNAGHAAEQASAACIDLDEARPSGRRCSCRREAARNHTPIIRPTMRGGASLRHRAHADRAEAQLAERVQSVGDDQPPRADARCPRRPGPSRRRAPARANAGPTKNKPSAELGRADRRLASRPSAIHVHAKTGASRMTKTGCTRLEPGAAGTRSRRRRCRCCGRRRGSASSPPARSRTRRAPRRGTARDDVQPLRSTRSSPCREQPGEERPGEASSR